MTSANPILRFAPSPNGRLHLGHAFSALFTARAAAVSGGTFLLRIEDIDPVRSKPEFDAGIVEDLAWLGLHWPEPALRQSARMPVYAAAAQALKEGPPLSLLLHAAQHYGSCGWTRSRWRAALSGICRGLPQGEVEGRFARGEQAQWRLKMDRATAEAGPLTISEAPAPGRDALWGEMVQRPADPMRWGDAVLIRKDVPASYHLSVVADDAAQCITHVTRGMDLFAATDLHVLLQRLLGLPSPRYCHHRLLRDEEGQKLAKSKGSVSLKSLRDGGATAADVRHSLGFD